MTRLEKIRSMSAEELGKALANLDWEYCSPEYCPHFREDGCCESMAKHGANGCTPACIRYLNEEIEDK